MARIKDGELYKQMRTRAARGLSEAIIALRHIDYNNPEHHNLKTIEHGVRAVEYFYQLSKDIEDVNQRLQGYKAKTKAKGTIIKIVMKIDRISSDSAITELQKFMHRELSNC